MIKFMFRFFTVCLFLITIVLIFSNLIGNQTKKNLTILDVESDGRKSKPSRRNKVYNGNLGTPALQVEKKNLQERLEDKALVKQRRSISSVDVSALKQVPLSVLGISDFKNLKLVQDLRIDIKDLGRDYKFVSGGYYFFENRSSQLSTVVWDDSKKRFAYFSGEVIIYSETDIRNHIETLGFDIISEPYKNNIILSASQYDDQTFIDLLHKLSALKSIKKIKLDLSYSQDLRQ